MEVYNPLDLTGKTILVTGASSGIGRSIAGVLAKLNARLVIQGRDQPRLDAVRNELHNSSLHLASAFSFTGDDAAVVAWLKQLTSGATGLFHGMVHSAGVSQTVPLRVISRAHIDAIFQPNVYAALALLKAASWKSVCADDSAIVLLSSVASVAGFSGLSAYAASKGALNALARSASLELAPRRIRVNCVAPALTETPMVGLAREELPGDFARNEQKQFLGVLDPEEVAVAVSFLLSPAARHITGTTLVMDGGRSC
jgi:NAD(P)-dependent dehydrogenase (short-subunit alcohol dehydrogenase family)